MTDACLKVLLVEDSRLIGSRISELIGSTPGLEVAGIVTTETGAVSEILETAPDVVVLDLQLKEGTGFGVLRSLKSLAAMPVVVVMTNYALAQYRREAFNLGAKYFLDKAHEFDELPAILTTLRAARHAG